MLASTQSTRLSDSMLKRPTPTSPLLHLYTAIDDTLLPRGVCSRILHLRRLLTSCPSSRYRTLYHFQAAITHPGRKSPIADMSMETASLVARIMQWMEFRREIHLQRPRELGRRAEGEVDVLAQHLGDVGTRHLHAIRELGLGNAKLLHAQENLPQEHRTDMVNDLHLSTRSRPVEYAAEYSTLGLFAGFSQDRFTARQSFKKVF